ncbi:MAG: [Fe-Fe] hydrogenase large subunit C-terminal domain-containing protein [Eubacteriales bacterium]|nr:[Fe-Fe] hydrogenase large subunit C-terminal domain-containing protein [Eubacteriales bacterium]
MDFIKFDKSNCKNCYKCIRHCPVKSIRFSGNLASVVMDECILCGQCYVVCPQNAKKIVDETEIVGVMLKESSPVYASVAPSFPAYFKGKSMKAFQIALKKLGFADVEETALGATLVKTEYERLTNLGELDVIITSCCHTINLLVEKYYPSLVGCLAPVMTPMRAHYTDLKRRHPNAKFVFIGPCLSKKDEANKDGIDATLTFDEISSMLLAAGITIGDEKDDGEAGLARLFPTNGGVLSTMQNRNPNYTYFSVDGIENCKNVLNDIAAGGLHKCFIEMSSCPGSCAGGPIMQKAHNNPLRNYHAVTTFAGDSDFSIEQPELKYIAADYVGEATHRIMPSESIIAEILKKMGKTKPEDELNCGTCGYDTCREKAIAVYQGKADYTMCLPHLMEKSERFANNILDNTPNGIMVVNDSFEIQQINSSALRMLNINTRTDVLGEQIVRIIDPTPFFDVMVNGKRVDNKRDYYPECGKFLELTIVHDRVSNQAIAIFRDVTDEENAKRNKEKFSRQTVETADKVVDKQMRIVQEIASLLGETAAETKIALTKLKESIANEDE